ncbi:transcriptional antiterminator/mannitol/fructose-specific phosphotransferase system IIA component (Ntr-type) [Geomicrobium halophilum]|uniref:Ascorbate-specific PTS system EIIA component n=1 Tax=Geomicrobium halophilum TaxID=549000 RepID=A0A841PQ32_9BACL|nr:BglG family transcription antiterminator [Geomicrobium halophilum]MBB6449934.1 transcriptional antiterminator/mannitol/fructose-specific phosphotransferase system IIA component (Ntr-type) [Geomicrobium halophilum]
MSISDRNHQILNELVNNPSITSMTLEKKYNLTRRQLGYSFRQINDWLMANNLPVIERTRKGYFIIDQSVFTKLDSGQEKILVENNILSVEQRIYLILIMLISSEEELSLHHFTSELDVSKNTVLNDLKQAQAFLSAFDLSIRYTRRWGYLIEGQEFQVRKLLMKVTYQVLQINNGTNRIQKITGLQNEQVDEFHQRIENVENKLYLKFTDEKIETMPYILILIKRRIKQENKINPFSIAYEELSDTKEYQATEEILYDLQEIPVTERLFITLHLLSTNVYWSESSMDEAIPNLAPAIDHMLRRFEKNACIYFQYREELLNKLLQHIKPAYYRIKYQLTEFIDIHNSLGKEFIGIHHLVKRSLSPLAELIGCDIPEHETRYITMLIGGWMRKQGESFEKKVKAIVVCPQGISVSRLMFTELRELFPEFVFLDSLSVREFFDYKLDYDIVFSPTFLQTDKKLFISKAFIGREEKQRLRKQVMLELHGYIPSDIDVHHILDIINHHTTIKNESALIEDLQAYIHRDEESNIKHRNEQNDFILSDFITPNHITLRDDVESWEEAIRISAQPLIESGNITKGYIEAMVNHQHDPYIVIGPNIAIPHAPPEEGVNEVGMSLLRLKEKVQFTSEHGIHLIIIIAAVDKKQHINALMQLMKLASVEHDRNKLIHANSIKEVHQIINLYSNDNHR